MYKTVRHGENSLQYTILPQQDEGTAVVTRPNGRRHKKKGKTAAVLAITIVLICGVIATAVLVPLLLTSDLVALPAAFQKFSVASMHTVHVGSHKEIIAKKPAEWRPHYVQLQTSTTTTTTTTTTTEKPTTTASTTTTAKTTSTTPAPTTAQLKGKSELSDSTTSQSSTTSTTTSTTTTTVMPTQSQTVPAVQLQKSEIHWGYVVSSGQETDFPAADSTPWYKFPTIRWPIDKDSEKLLVTLMACGGVITLCLLLVVVTWLKKRRLRRNRTITERMTADSQTADKENLLTDAAGLSDEEQ